MTWTIVNNPDHQYVEGIFKGKTSWQDMKELTAECISIQRKQGTRYFLINTLEMLSTASIADVFQLPAHEYEQQGVNRETKIALVYSPVGESSDLATFYETACINRGWQARCFTNEQDAICWFVGEH